MYFDVRAAKLLQPGGHLLVQGCAGLPCRCRRLQRVGACWPMARVLASIRRKKSARLGRYRARLLLAQVGCPNEIGEAIVGHIPKDVVGTYNAYSYDAERLHWLGKLDGLLASLAGDAPARP